MRTKFLCALMLLSIAAFGQQNPIQIDANGLTQTLSSGGLVVRGQIVKINSSGQVVPMATTDTSGAIGIAATSQQNQGQSVTVSLSGVPLIQIDSGGCAAGNRVSISSITAGAGHCATTATGQQIGIALSASSPGSTFWNIQLGPLAAGSGASGSIATTIDVTNSGVKADVKTCFDGTVTNASPNISSAGQCQWTSADVGKKVFVTSLCNSVQCGFTFGMTSVTILPSTQVTVARISSVTDATHIVTDCNSPANCSSPNASASLAGNATVIYGDDDTTALNNAFATWTNTNVCPTFLFPAGLMFYNSALFVTLPNIANNACTAPTTLLGSKNANLGQAIGNGAVIFKGQGQFSTLFVPTPDFNFSSCPASPNFSCFTGWLSPVFEDFGVWGGGQSLLGAGVGGGSVLFACNSCVMQNVSLTMWGSRSTVTGVDTNAGFAVINNLYQNSFGGQGGGMVIHGDGNQISNSTLGFSSSSMVVNGKVNTSNVIFYGPTQFNSPVVDVSAIWESSNDRTLNGTSQTAPTPAVKVENGGYAGINNFFYQSTSNANDSGLSVVAGGVARVNGWKTSVSTLTSGGNIAGTLLGWGNDFGGPLTVTGNVVNAPSEQGNWTCVTSTATITFHSPVTYRSNPVVLLTDNTTSGGARISAENTTTATVTCTGASDVGVYSVTPNPN